MNRDRAVGFLAGLGAGSIDHFGGSLLEHLERVERLLGEWDAPGPVRMAGLTHAFYGTDGFPVALGDVERRDELASVVGPDVEELVYLYGGCDRAFTYPELAAGGEFRDRFTGEVRDLPDGERRAFAEITVANELDVLRADAAMRERHGAALMELFVTWEPLLSPAAREAVRDEPW